MGVTRQPDIPSTDQSPTRAEEQARKQIVREYERLTRDKMTQISNNAAAYTNKRVRSKSGVTKDLRKILSIATFVAAHPYRYKTGGYVITETKYFILHRAGNSVKGARIDNIIREFVQPNRDASAHFIISQTGAIIQMVDLADTAIHCGDSSPAFNSNSVGVELEGAIGTSISAAMFQALATLIATIAKISGMPITEGTVLNHASILPRQKRDAWVTQSRRGKIVDSKIKKIVKDANVVLNSLSGSETDFYQPPFDARVDALNKATELQALSSAPGTSYLEMARIQAAASSQAASARAMAFSWSTREEIGAAAATQAGSALEQQAQELAAFIRDNNIKSVPTPQTNNGGVLFNRNTGLLNNGEPA